MLEPVYRDGWNPSKVAAYLLTNSDFVEWIASDNGLIDWIDSEGRAYHMLDDLDARALAVRKFFADRKRVTRSELLAEFPPPEA